MSCSKEIYLTHSSGKTHIINRIPNNVNSLQQTQSPFPAPFITLPPRRTCFHILISPKGGLFVWQRWVSSFLWGAVTTSAGSGGRVLRRIWQCSPTGCQALLSPQLSGLATCHSDPRPVHRQRPRTFSHRCTCLSGGKEQRQWEERERRNIRISGGFHFGLIKFVKIIQ